MDDAGRAVVDALTSLVDKSLVTLDEGADRSGRYRLLEPVRQYGHIHLLEAAEAERTRRKHATYYFTFGEDAERGLQGPQQPVWVIRVEHELDNLRACFEWSIEHDPRAAVQLWSALQRYWMLAASQVTEVRAWLNRAIQALPEQDQLRAQGLCYACYSAKYQGEYEEARRLGRQSLSLATQLGSARLMGLALVALAGVDSAEGLADGESIVSYCEQAELLLCRSVTPDEFAHQLSNIGEYVHRAGDLSRARAKLQESVALARELDDKFLLISGLARVARVEFDESNVPVAAAHCKEGLLLEAEMRGIQWIPNSLRLLARLAIANQQPERCLRLLSAAVAIQKQTERLMDAATEREVTRARDAALQLIGHEAADAAWREGLQLSFADAVRYGVEDVLPPEPLKA